MSYYYDSAKDLKSQINRETVITGCLRQIVRTDPFMRTDSKIDLHQTNNDINGGNKQNQNHVVGCSNNEPKNHNGED